MLSITPNVTSITGTANEIIASSPTGNVTLSAPQDIATTSTPTFAGIQLNGSGSVNININSVSINAIEDITSNAIGGVFQSLLESHTSTSSTAPTIAAIKSSGTRASPTISAINDAIGFHNFYGYTGNSSVGYQLASQVQYWICADGTTVSTTSMPGRIQFFTTPDLSVTPAERMRINCTGTISLFGPLQMSSNKIYGDSASGGTLTLSANSNANLNYLVLGGTTNKLDVFSGQPTVTVSQTVLNYSPTFTLGPGAVNVNQIAIGNSPTITIASGGGTVAGLTGLNISETITHNSSLATVYVAIQLQPTITSTANAGFASSFTMFNGNPVLASSTAGVYPFPITGMFTATPTYNAGNVDVSSSSPTFDIGGKHASAYNCTGASSKMTLSTQGWVDLITLNANTAGSVLTCTSRIGFLWKAVAFTATGSVVLTDNVGIDLADQSATTGNFTSTNVYGIRSAITSGTNRWFLYDSGGVNSSIKGNLRLGDNTAPTALLDLVGKLTADNNGKVTKYNNISLVLCGVSSLVANVGLTTQAAAISTVTLYAVPSSTTGQYQINWSAKITRAATSSSTLGGLTITYTDPDSVVQTISAGAQLANGTLALTATTNNTTTVLLGYGILINCKASTNIQYAFAYASSGATTMQYNLNIQVEAC